MPPREGFTHPWNYCAFVRISYSICSYYYFQGSLSDDERSVHYSSSGYYESPVEDEDDGGLSKDDIL